MKLLVSNSNVWLLNQTVSHFNLEFSVCSFLWSSVWNQFALCRHNVYFNAQTLKKGFCNHKSIK